MSIYIKMASEVSASGIGYWRKHLISYLKISVMKARKQKYESIENESENNMSNINGVKKIIK